MMSVETWTSERGSSSVADYPKAGMPPRGPSESLLAFGRIQRTCNWRPEVFLLQDGHLKGRETGLLLNLSEVTIIKKPGCIPITVTVVKFPTAAQEKYSGRATARLAQRGSGQAPRSLLDFRGILCLCYSVVRCGSRVSAAPLRNQTSFQHRSKAS